MHHPFLCVSNNSNQNRASTLVIASRWSVVATEIEEIRGQNENTTECFSKSENSHYGSIEAIFSPKPEEEAKKKKKYTKTQWLTLVTLAFGNICSGSCASLQAPFFPSEAEKKGATATEYGFIFGIFHLTMFVTAPLIGKILPYTSPKFLLNSGMLTTGVACILFGTLDLVMDSTSFVALAFVIRTVEGVGEAAVQTSCYTFIASQFPEGIGTVFAILETIYGLGFIIGPTVGGALYDLGGYEIPFWTMGTMVLVDAALIFFILPDIEDPKMPEKGSMLKFWIHPRTLLYSFSIFTTFNYVGFIQVTLEPHIRNFNLSGFAVGVMFALSGAVYALTAPAWGWLCDKKYNTITLSLLGCFIMVSSLTLVGPAPFLHMEPNIWMITVSRILMGIGIGGKLVSAFTGVLEDTVNRGLPPDLSTYGLVSSMIATSQSLGFFIGPSVGGYLLDSIGFGKASMSLIILETVLIVLFIVSICNRRNLVKKAALTDSTESIALSNSYVPKNGECKKNTIRTNSM